MAPSRKKYRIILLLILTGAGALFLAGNERMPLWDRDEPRYAECSREMLQSGDWVVPRYLGDLRTHKPPLIYWCQAAAMSLFGPTGGAARLPSALGVFLTAVLLAGLVWKSAGPRRAAWTTLIFSTSALAIAAAKFCNTDGLLLLWIALGQGCLFLLWNGRAKFNYLIACAFWVSVGLAGLTKGPVVLAMHAATIAVLALLDSGTWKERIAWLRKLHPIVGLVIVVAIVSPWLILVNQRAPEFLKILLNRAGKYASTGAEGHAHWPGFYLLLIWGLFFPWSLMLPTAIGMGLRHRQRPLLRFAWAAAIGPWIVMELVPNKLPFYILPIFPGLAILAAEAIVRSSCARRGSADDDLKQRIFVIGACGWALGAVAVGVCVRIVTVAGGGAAWLGWTWMTLGIALAIGVPLLFALRRVAFASAAMGVGTAILAGLLVTAILPNLPLVNASRQIGDELNRQGAGGATPVAMIDFREPSLAFYQGGGAREIDAAALDLPDGPQWAVLTTDAWTKLDPDTRARYEIVGPRYPVLIYNDGRQYRKLLILHKTGD